jgi:hypothetical protein
LAGGDPSTIDWTSDQVRYQQVGQDRMLAVFGRILQTDLTEGLRAFVQWHTSREPAAAVASTGQAASEAR